MSYPSRKSYPRVTMMNLDPTAQRKKARSISAKGLAKHATPPIFCCSVRIKGKRGRHTYATRFLSKSLSVDLLPIIGWAAGFWLFVMCWTASHGQIHHILRTLTIEGQHAVVHGVKRV
jgi:hypothetical protein